MSIPDLTDFERWARRLRRSIRYAERVEKQGGTLRPAETADGVLRVQCYRYYRRLKRAGELGRLAEHLANDATGRWSRHKGKGADAVLRLLERPGEGWWITPSRRGRIVCELNFADRFDIHSRLLLPFLFEAGSHELIRKAAIEKQPAPWIARYQRLSEVIREEFEARKAVEAADAGSLAS